MPGLTILILPAVNGRIRYGRFSTHREEQIFPCRAPGHQRRFSPSFVYPTTPLQARERRAGMLVILQVQFMNHLGDFFYRLVFDPKRFHQYLKSAKTADMGEIPAADVKENLIRVRGRRRVVVKEREARLFVDEVSNEPCRCHAVDKRISPRNPGSLLVVFGFCAFDQRVKTFFRRPASAQAPHLSFSSRETLLQVCPRL